MSGAGRKSYGAWGVGLHGEAGMHGGDRWGHANGAVVLWTKRAELVCMRQADRSQPPQPGTHPCWQTCPAPAAAAPPAGSRARAAPARAPTAPRGPVAGWLPAPPARSPWRRGGRGRRANLAPAAGRDRTAPGKASTVNGNVVPALDLWWTGQMAGTNKPEQDLRKQTIRTARPSAAPASNAHHGRHVHVRGENDGLLVVPLPAAAAAAIAGRRAAAAVARRGAAGAWGAKVLRRLHDARGAQGVARGKEAAPGSFPWPTYTCPMGWRNQRLPRQRGLRAGAAFASAGARRRRRRACRPLTSSLSSGPISARHVSDRRPRGAADGLRVARQGGPRGCGRLVIGVTWACGPRCDTAGAGAPAATSFMSISATGAGLGGQEAKRLLLLRAPRHSGTPGSPAPLRSNHNVHRRCTAVGRHFCEVLARGAGLGCRGPLRDSARVPTVYASKVVPSECRIGSGSAPFVHASSHGSRYSSMYSRSVTVAIRPAQPEARTASHGAATGDRWPAAGEQPGHSWLSQAGHREGQQRGPACTPHARRSHGGRLHPRPLRC